MGVDDGREGRESGPFCGHTNGHIKRQKKTQSAGLMGGKAAELKGLQ